MKEWNGEGAKRRRGQAGKSVKAALLAGVFGLAWANGAYADTTTPAAEPSDTIDSLLIVAKRNDAAKTQMRAANAIAVLSAEDLEHTAVHNVAEALGMMPSVNVMNTGSSFFGGCRFQKTAALNVRSRLHYSSGGVGSIRQRRAAAGHQRTQGGLSATGRSMRHRWPSRRGSESARIDLRCPTSH